MIKRACMSRKKGGRGLDCIEDCVDVSVQRLVGSSIKQEETKETRNSINNSSTGGKTNKNYEVELG